MSVRAPRAADAGAIREIWNAVIRDTDHTFTTLEKSQADIVALIERNPGHGFFVADVDGAVAGFACCDQLRPGVGYRHTLELSVHLAPWAQGQGIGRALVGRLADHAAGQGAHALWAAVSGTNAGAQRFFAALGFAAVAVLPAVGRKGGRWLDLHLLRLPLDNRT